MKGNIKAISGDIILDGRHSAILTWSKDLNVWTVEIKESKK